MKVGITGSHGCGKTVAVYDLVSDLKKLNYNADLIVESARNCPLVINEDATINSQLWIFGETLRREQEAKADIVVCDRTLIDVLAYTKRISEHVYRELEPFVDGYSKTYDIIFYMEPKEGYLKEDGKRSINVAFQKEIKVILDNIIKDLNIPVIKIDDRKERLMYVVNDFVDR